MAEKQDFSFRILVLEDDLYTKNDLDLALKRVLSDCNRSYAISYVDSSRQAWNCLLQKRYHFISIDQNIPDNIGEITSSDEGIFLCEKIVDHNILIYKIIYTAYGEVAFSNYIDNLGGTAYLEKKVGRGKEKDNAYSSFEWAEYIKSTLENDYIPFALEQARKYLPLSLAERARRTLAAYREQTFEPYIRLWIEIWESALHLAFAQTLALCHHAGLSLGGVPDGSLAEQERLLREIWPKLARDHWMAPWLRYIGVGNRESGAGTGGVFLRSASDPLRRLRNELPHSFPIDAWDQLTAEYKEPLLFLIDVLAYWIENPLMMGMRFHPTQRHRVMGNAVMGDQVPFPQREVDIHDLAEIPKDANEHMCLIWHREVNQSLILDLDPFIVFERDQQGRPHLMLLMRPTKQRERWMYRSLTDGRLYSRSLAPLAQKAVQAVFR